MGHTFVGVSSSVVYKLTLTLKNEAIGKTVGEAIQGVDPMKICEALASHSCVRLNYVILRYHPKQL